jgi:MFS family permease
MEHKKWVILCFIGGVLMVLSSVVGSVGFIGTVLSLAAGVLGLEMTQFFSILLTILGYIAAGGGISVIVGALIAGYGPDRIGRIVIGVGIGTGLIGLIIILITNLIAGVSISDLPNIFLSAFNGTYGLAGVLISIFSRMRLKD